MLPYSPRVHHCTTGLRFREGLQAKNAASDLMPFMEAFLGIRIVLLALKKGDVFAPAFRRDVLRRRHQHRRRRDRVHHHRSIHGARHLQFQTDTLPSLINAKKSKLSAGKLT